MPRLRRHLLLAVLFALLTLATSSFARGQFWDFLGYTQLDTTQDHGRIRITRHDLGFRTIQLRVGGAPIFLDRLVLHFENGASQELSVGARISPGGSNYVIDVLGERALESVELWYYKEAWGRKPTVSAYGTHSPDRDAETVARTQ